MKITLNRYFRLFARLFTLLIITVPLSAQKISNVKASFDIETYEVTVSYYLESSKPCDLLLYCSIDNGNTWERCVSVSGNIKDQMTGNKRIVWNLAIDGIPVGVFLFKVSVTGIEPVTKTETETRTETGIRTGVETETRTVTETRTRIEMVFVQGGTFWMGCTSDQGSDCYNDEKPVHQVTLNNFYIGKYEITQAQWETIMGTTIKQQRDKVYHNEALLSGEGDNYPMYYVSWEDAQEFIKRLNAATGKKYRLPTEAEWEYAARGGNQSRGYKYSGINNIDEVAWYIDNSGRNTHPVGTKKANELGIYDMSGNVWEWCNDWYGSYSSYAQTNPAGVSSSSYRVIRGGSWSSFAGDCRVANRSGASPGDRYGNLGFRVAYSSE
jgi:formylglycine-generating enzyme required for sulfatase activity